MARRLTKKQRGFVHEYLVTGNGTKSALATYDTDNERVAENIGSTNLSKPIILDAIDAALSDELLASKHLELLNKMDDLGQDIDANAVSKGLDMAYKIKGKYAAEKSIRVNVDLSELQDQITKQIAEFRGLVKP